MEKPTRMTALPAGPSAGPRGGLSPPAAASRAGAPSEASDVRALFDRAVDLAFFILGDRACATEVALEALAKVQVAAETQHRRLAYLPKHRAGPGGAGRPRRNRVIAGNAHLLQRLVYVECEAHERRQEREAGVGRRELTLRFVKHLVRITLKRNAFYVVLGVSRLLHRYSTAETMELYSLVIQDPERVRDDHYYRSRKKQLMQEVLARFGRLLFVEDGPRGERRFRTRTPDAESEVLVRDCLRRFTPWDTRCVVPEGLDRWSSEIPELAFEGGDPDAEHPVEMSRIHAALDPRCFARLVGALVLPPPDQRLALPEFDMPTHASRGGFGKQSPSAGGWTRARQRLADDAQRRGRSGGRVLSVVVDGCEHARLDLARSGHCGLRLDAGAELVEVRDGDGLLLAVWLVAAPERPSSAARYVVTLENRREIAIQSRRGADAEQLHVEVSCRETELLRAVRLHWARFRARLLAAAPPRRALPALAAVGAAAGAVIVMLSLHPATTRPPDAPSAPRAGRAPAGPVAPTSGTATGGAPLDPGASRSPAPSGSRELTRDGPSASSGLPLSRVKRVWIDRLGGGVSARALTRELTARLETSARFAVAAQRREADAVLKGTVTRQGVAALELVNAAGEVLWRSTHRMGDEPAADASTLIDALSAAAPRYNPEREEGEPR